MNQRLARTILIGASMAAVCAVYQTNRAQPSDLAQLWHAARSWMHGLDPYSSVGPGRAFDWPFPLLYPMTAVLAAVPLVALPLWVADPLFVGLGAACLAWVLMRDRFDDPRLLVFLSGAGVLAVQTSQWSPLMCASVFLPGLGFLLACKPTLGLALLTAFPSWRVMVGIGAFALVSLVAWPTWPVQWLDALPAATHIVAPVMRPGGVLVLAVLYHWRVPEARLVAAWACMPQTPEMYEAVPLFLIPHTWRESGILAGLTILTGALRRWFGPYPSYEAYMDVGGTLIVWLLFVPSACMVIWQHRSDRKSS